MIRCAEVRASGARLSMLRRAGGLLLALAATVGACGNEDESSSALVYRCSQTPILTLVEASCACTGYTPGTEGAFVGVEVAACDASLPCCFIGDSPPNRDGSPNGVKECRCVHAASCDAAMAERPGVTSVAACPPAG